MKKIDYYFKRSAHSAVPVQWFSGSVVQWFIGFRARFFFEERFETIEGSRKRPEGDPIAICMVLEGSRDPRQSLGRQKP